MDSGSLVRIFSSREMARFLFAKSLLDREKIAYVAKGDVANTVLGGWVWTLAFGSPELWVARDDAERARDLFVKLADDAFRFPPCSYCGSSQNIGGRPQYAASVVAGGCVVGVGLAVIGFEIPALETFIAGGMLATALYARFGRDRCRSCGRVRAT